MFRATTAAFVIALASASVPLFADEPAQDQEKKEETKKVDPIDFRKLKEFLPATVAGLVRADAKGNKMSIGEAKVTQAEGEYHVENNETNASVIIFDYGALPEMVQGMTAWTTMDIDNESDDEYTKTVTYGKYRGLETFNTKDKRGTLQLLVGARFFITVTLNGIDPAEFAKTVESMKLADLEALAK